MSEARGALAFATMVGVTATIVWIVLSDLEHLKPATSHKSVDPEVLLCDQAVEALLHSKDLVEVTRAGIIVQAVNCGIGKRLP